GAAKLTLFDVKYFYLVLYNVSEPDRILSPDHGGPVCRVGGRALVIEEHQPPPSEPDVQVSLHPALQIQATQAKRRCACTCVVLRNEQELVLPYGRLL